MRVQSLKSIDLGFSVDTLPPSTAFFIQGFGHEATEDVGRIASALLPLSPEGDASQSLGLLLRHEGADVDVTTKLHAYAGDPPPGWPTPNLGVFLADGAALLDQTVMLRSMARLGPECLCVVLCCSDSDRDSLYTNLAAATPIHLAVFTVESTDPLARVWLSCGLVTSLYRTIVCVDFADLRCVLTGKGLACWRRDEKGDKGPPKLDLNAAISQSDFITGVFYGRIGGVDVSLEAFMDEAQATLGISRVAQDKASLVLSCVLDEPRRRGHGSFMFASSSQ